ncbi:Na(+)/drug antiporter [Limihaloglobus sulfuriphilus]|uniref:Multidrug-efflux transporter n=1 Tax=Limihaloglobus sulfuriphilus TaxID=1851148 RepID=A0A1Q2MIG0_9BACT|nr:MATE family efflux transporter [Limihaloglobus sulfuriphilus]AQQ72308.1 Na(+)/drug antiporter [Limihaloglobus sulfuriphilus]
MLTKQGFINNFWSGPGGCGELMKIAAPLIVSTSAFTVRMFTDRLFLSNYSPNAMTGAMFAGIFHFTLISLFLGIVSYANTFVAQYTGAKQRENIGPIIWQAIYLSIVMGMAMMVFLPMQDIIFNAIGHDSEIKKYEIEYFSTLLYVGLPLLISRAISSFYSGRGITSVVMWINIFNSILNIGLNYLLIFGKLGLPAMGVTGAALATVLSEYAALAVFAYLFFMPHNRKEFNTLHGRGLSVRLIRELMRYGLPSGLHFILDMLAFSFFLMIIGRFGAIQQLASSMVFNVNMFAFMPMIGLGIGISILVGQYLGRNEPDIAERSVWIAFKVCAGYMLLISVCYIFFGRMLMGLYPFSKDPELYSKTVNIAVKLMYFLAAYSVIDAANIIFSNALKGAGDTRFVMILSVSLHWGLMVIPSMIFAWFGFGIYSSWTFLTLFVSVLGLCFYLRFRGGLWKSMRVIETEVIPETELI